MKLLESSKTGTGQGAEVSEGPLLRDTHLQKTGKRANPRLPCGYETMQRVRVGLNKEQMIDDRFILIF